MNYLSRPILPHMGCEDKLAAEKLPLITLFAFEHSYKPHYGFQSEAGSQYHLTDCILTLVAEKLLQEDREEVKSPLPLVTVPLFFYLHQKSVGIVVSLPLLSQRNVLPRRQIIFESPQGTFRKAHM